MTKKKSERPSALYDPQILYQDLVETSQDLIWQCDSQGRYTYLNQAWETTFGYKVEEMLGRSFSDFQSPECSERDMEVFASILEGKTLKGHESTHIGKSGKKIHLVFNAKVVFDEQGNAIGTRGTAYDITERKLAEQEMSQIKVAIDAAGDAIGMSTPQGHHFYQNEAFNRLFGYTLEEVTRLHPVVLYGNEEDGKMVFDRIMAGKSWHGELEMVDKSGRRFPVLLRADAIKDESGKIIGLVGVHTDITQRKQAEEAVAAEKELLATTLRSIGDGVITTDTKGIITTVNRVAEELTGWTHKEAAGKPLTSVFKIINKDTREPCENPVDAILASGRSVDLPDQSLLISRDGTERNISDSGAPIKDRNSNTIGVVLVFRDTTEKQRLMDAMQRADKLDTVGVLAGGIAHDFNNLLSGMFGYIDIARRAGAGNREVVPHLEKALSVYGRAKDLTQQLLTFAKGGAPVRRTGSLGPLVVKSARFALSGSKIGCEFGIAENLFLCDFDENQMGQVVNNIVINAQQAMPDGGKMEIRAENVKIGPGQHSTLSPGPYVKVSISDTGHGIEPSMIKKIFDPFFTTKHHGYGLGLATCYSIIQKHDGCIDVESIPGQGSTFFLFIRASSSVSEPKTKPSTTTKTRGNILVMDDQDFIRDLVGQMLELLGYGVFKTKDGEETLEIFAQASKKGEPITCAILDLTVPGGMGGRETVEELRKTHPDLPIFASSGYSEDPIMANPNEYGFTDSIRKPYLTNELVDLLNKHLK